MKLKKLLALGIIATTTILGGINAHAQISDNPYVSIENQNTTYTSSFYVGSLKYGEYAQYGKIFRNSDFDRLEYLITWMHPDQAIRFGVANVSTGTFYYIPISPGGHYSNYVNLGSIPYGEYRIVITGANNTSSYIEHLILHFSLT